MPTPLQQMTPEEEVAHMREQLELLRPVDIMNRVVGHFDVLQARAGMMISLIALCLTISGFSGHRIASAGLVPAVLMGFGFFFAILAAILLFTGPLQLRWATAYRHADGIEAQLVAMIRLRNCRTRRYHQAAACLILGLSCYLSAVIGSLFPGGAGL